ncbi:OB-fold protein [Streptomyces sp. NBC_00576]|uniref:OB-fold protein n=1 Tax=Streptomyces sp. NBC_00576 TaxID=2903665 RepID=UPI003FCD3407
MKIRDLHNEFAADRAAAERAYYGKFLTLEGISIRTGESQYGTPVVEVSDVPGGPHLAIFVLPFDHRIKESFRLVRSVPLGVTVTVRGECRVFSEDGTVLVIKECELLTP